MHGGNEHASKTGGVPSTTTLRPDALMRRGRLSGEGYIEYVESGKV